MDLGGAGGSVDLDSGDGVVVVFDEAGDFVLHKEVEGGELCGMGGEEAKEVPLGHEGDEFGCSREVGEVSHGDRDAADGEAEGGELLVGEVEEGFEEAELVHELEGGGVDCVAAEVAEEVFVLFEDGDIDAGAGEEEAEHHACRASAYNATGGFGWRDGGDGHGWDEGSKGGWVRQR